MRAVNKGVLGWYQVTYRAIIIVAQFAFNLVWFGALRFDLATNAAYTVVWNVVNGVLGFLYSWLFFSFFKLGKVK